MNILFKRKKYTITHCHIAVAAQIIIHILAVWKLGWEILTTILKKIIRNIREYTSKVKTSKETHDGVATTTTKLHRKYRTMASMVLCCKSVGASDFDLIFISIEMHFCCIYMHQVDLVIESESTDFVCDLSIKLFFQK